MEIVLETLLGYNTLDGKLIRVLGDGAQWLSDKLSKPEDEK